MTIWIRKNKDGKVVEKTTTNPIGRYHPSIVWEIEGDSKFKAGVVMANRDINSEFVQPRSILFEGHDISENDEESTEAVEEDTSNTAVESTEEDTSNTAVESTEEDTSNTAVESTA